MNPNEINPNSSFGKEQIMSPVSYGVTNQLSENVILTVPPALMTMRNESETESLNSND